MGFNSGFKGLTMVLVLIMVFCVILACNVKLENLLRRAFGEMNPRYIE